MSENNREYKSSLLTQCGGNHYKEKGIQPIEYINANDLSFFQGNIIKYVTRYKDKNGVEDLKKAIHYLQMILEFDYDVLADVSYSDSDNGVSNSRVKEVVQDSQQTPWYPPVEDGGNPWIEYYGNGQTVSGLNKVNVLFRIDRLAECCVDSKEFVKDFDWDHTGGSYDIVAYRVIE